MAENIIQPSGNPVADLNTIQDALDNAKNGDTITLKGDFDLRQPPDEEHPEGYDGHVYIRNADVAHLVLRGFDTKGNPGHVGSTDEAVIRHAMVRWGRSQDPNNTAADRCVPVSATVQNITFDGFTAHGIQIAGTVGKNRLQQCTFRNYRYGLAEGGAFSGAWPVRVEPIGGAAVKLPTMLTGTLEIVSCHFQSADYASLPPGVSGMNNVLHLNNAHLDLLRIADNEIDDMSWVAIVVWGIMGMTEIVHNSITLTSAHPYKVGNGVQTAAIAFGANPGYRMNYDGSVRIERNTISIERPDAAGIAVQLYADGQYREGAPVGSKREVTVRNNVVHMMSPNNDGIALACLGACSASNWAGNIVTGHAQYGILVSKTVMIGAPSNAAPSNNTFEGNILAGAEDIIDPATTDPLNPWSGGSADFAAFTAAQAQIIVDGTVTELVGKSIRLWQNSVGPVSGSNQGQAPFAEPCAGIVSSGKHIDLKWNHFSTSGLKGWHLKGAKSWPPGDHQVGCIYLAPVTEENTVTWCETNFPDKSTPLPERQILNLAGNANDLVELPESIPVVHELPEPQSLGSHTDIPVGTVPLPEPLIGARH